MACFWLGEEERADEFSDELDEILGVASSLFDLVDGFFQNRKAVLIVDVRLAKCEQRGAILGDELPSRDGGTSTNG